AFFPGCSGSLHIFPVHSSQFVFVCPSLARLSICYTKCATTLWCLQPNQWTMFHPLYKFPYGISY
ncbi:11841_t:CDS:1, partial [Dentiscutata heterogama]